MDALQLLKEQHTEVDDLLSKLENARSQDRRQALFEEMADKLAAHATIEEKIFYPAVKSKKTEELVLESVEEHLSIKRVLADMLELDVEDEQFDAKLAVLKEQVDHHAHEEEEKELFPEVRKLLSKDELEGLGGEMAAMFEELMGGSPRKNVPSETSEAVPV